MGSGCSRVPTVLVLSREGCSSTSQPLPYLLPYLLRYLGRVMEGGDRVVTAQGASTALQLPQGHGRSWVSCGWKWFFCGWRKEGQKTNKQTKTQKTNHLWRVP